MPTERLYYTDSYLLEFDGIIDAIRSDERGFWTQLSRSAFYPTSGGQNYDLGILGERGILDVQNQDGEVWHLTAELVGQKGDSVHGEIDGIRRRRHRQVHTAQHVVSAVLLRDYGAETTSVHLGVEYGAIDVDKGNVSELDIPLINQKLQFEIEAALPISIHFAEGEEVNRFPLRRPPKKSGRIRIVAIGEHDYAACGGTHCRSTAELISIRITGIDRRHGKQSVQFIAADQFLDDYEARYAATTQLTQKFNCEVGQIAARIENHFQNAQEIRSQYDEAIKELVPVWADRAVSASELSTATTVTALYRPSLTKEPGRELGNAIVARTNGICLIGSSDVTLLVNSSSKYSSKALFATLLPEFNLRGGGTDQLAQTSSLSFEQFAAFEARLRSLLK